MVGKEAWAGRPAAGYHGAGVDLVQREQKSLGGGDAQRLLVRRLVAGGQRG